MPDYTYKYVHLIRKYADEHPKMKSLVKSQVLCGCSILPVKGELPAVYLLSNGNRSIFIGNSSCKNAWTCPKCAAKKARTACVEISGIIDAMKLRGCVPIMMTLTVPHSQNQSVEFTVDVLYTAWRKFKTGKCNTSRDKKFGTGNAFIRFCREFDIKHWYRAAEATFGHNGWHPHFHCLLFVPRQHLKKLAAWEGRLRRSWFRLVLRCMVERWKNDGSNESRADFLRRRIVEQKNSESSPLFLSKDGNGDIAAVNASAYLAGIASAKNAAFELSSIHLKQARAGHLTSFEVLHKAYTCYAANDEDGFNLWMGRYFDLMKATKFRRKFDHSRQLTVISANQIKDVRLAYVAKGLDQYRCVTYFTAAEWAGLSWLERTEPVFATLCDLAIDGDEDRILSYLDSLGFTLQPRAQNDFVKLVEDMANCVPLS